MWTIAIFGKKSDDRTSLLKRLVRSSNRYATDADASVTVSIRIDILPPSCVSVYWNGARIASPDVLDRMAERVQRSVFSYVRPRGQHPTENLDSLRGTDHPYDDSFAPSHTNLCLPEIPTTVMDADLSADTTDVESVAQYFKAQGRLLYGKGDYFHAYESALKASELYTQVDDEQAVGSLLDAWASSRPVAQGRWVRDVQHRLIAAISTKGLSSYLIARSLAGVATILFDYGDPESALRLYRKAENILACYRKHAGDGIGMRHVDIEWNSIKRRIAYIMGGSDLEGGIDLLKDVSQAFSDLRSEERRGNARLSMVCLYAKRHMWQAALECLCVHEVELSRGSKWTQVGTLAAKGYLELKVGQRKQGVLNSERAFREFHLLRVVPPSLEGFGDVFLFRPDLVLGCEHKLVRECGTIKTRGRRPITRPQLREILHCIEGSLR